MYADLDVNLKANSTPPMQHPVVYALIDGSSLAPRSVENNTPCKCAWHKLFLAAIPTQVNTFPYNYSLYILPYKLLKNLYAPLMSKFANFDRLQLLTPFVAAIDVHVNN